MLPSLLTSRLQSILSKDYDTVLEALTHERNGSLRINLLKGDGSDVLMEFSEKGIVIIPFEGIDGGYMFDRAHEYAIKGTRAFYDGKIYLQSIASMLPVLVLEPQSGETILDICAAPGSKTTQMAMMMRNTGKIVAIEQNQIRYDKLMHNCTLQGATIVEGVKLDARKYLIGDFEVTGGEIHKKGKYAKYIEPTASETTTPLERTIPLFDRILLDAPCSAEGRILISNEKSYGFWSLDNIARNAALQYELLSLALTALAAGGTLVYSTCTLAPEENEAIIARILAEHPDLALEDISLGLSERSWWRPGHTSWEGTVYDDSLAKSVRILPSAETEGFYIARIVKR